MTITLSELIKALFVLKYSEEFKVLNDLDTGQLAIKIFSEAEGQKKLPKNEKPTEFLKQSSSGSMWEPFTERARRSIVFAQEECQRLGNNYVGTEHVLMGIISEGESKAAKGLIELGLTLSRVRNEVELIIGRGSYTVVQEMVFTPRAKKVIERAFEYASLKNINYIAPECLLYGLTEDSEGVAARVISNLSSNTKVKEMLEETWR